MGISAAAKIRVAGALALAGLAGAIGTAYLASLQLQEHARAVVTMDLRAAVNTLRVEVRTGTQMAETSVSGTASGPALNAALRVRDGVVVGDILETLMRQSPSLLRAAVYDANGWLVARVPLEPQVADEARPADTTSPEATAPKLIQGDATYLLKYPVKVDGGGAIGSLLAEVSIRRSAPGVELFRLGTTGRASIVGRGGTVLLSGEPERVGTKTNSGITAPAIARWRSSSIEGFSAIVGRDELIAFGPSSAGLGVMVTRSKSEAFGSVMSFGWNLLLGLVFLMSGIAGAAALGKSALRDERREGVASKTELQEATQLLPGMSTSMHEAHSNIANLVRTLRERGPDLAPETQDLMFAKIEGSVVAIERISERLHFAAMIESGTLALGSGSCDLKFVAMGAMKKLSLDPIHHRTQTVIPDDLTIQGSARSLSRVIEELTWNAARFSDPGSLIIVRARRSGNDAILSVDDEGDGVAPDVLPFLFTRSGSGHDSMGQGIGLWIAREIVTKMGGELWCEPKTTRGSTFTCRLPIQPTTQVLVDLGSEESVRTS